MSTLAGNLILISTIARMRRVREESAGRLAHARDAYYQSLQAFEQNVDDHALKQDAFVAGIVYATLMSIAGQESDFDQDNVAQDIERAIRLGQRGDGRQRVTAERRLRELEALCQAGLITDEEYSVKRAEILASM